MSKRPTEVNVRVYNNQTSLGAITFGLLLIVVMVLTYWKIIAIAAVIGFAVYRVTVGLARGYARINELKAHADEQDAWVYSGDPRGTYGHDWRGSA